MANWKQQYKGDAILFLEAGFIAVNQADEDSSVKLFKAAQALDPDNPLVKVGFGFLHLHKLELKQACKMFEEVLEADPKNEMAKALLGITMTFSPAMASKGEELLKETYKSKDPSIKQLSDTGVAFAEKFMKKSPSPVEGRKSK